MQLRQTAATSRARDLNPRARGSSFPPRHPRDGTSGRVFMIHRRRCLHSSLSTPPPEPQTNASLGPAVGGSPPRPRYHTGVASRASSLVIDKGLTEAGRPMSLREARLPEYQPGRVAAPYPVEAGKAGRRRYHRRQRSRGMST